MLKREWTDGQILAGISAALKAGDLDAVVNLLHLLALQAPDKAKAIYDAVVHRKVTVEVQL